MATPRNLASHDALDAAVTASHERPVFVFKHSLICPVSTRADDAYAAFVSGRDEDDMAFHRIEIQNARPVSDAVAERTGVRHESPQALLFVNGEVVWHASHGAITPEALAAAWDEARAD